MFEGLTTEGIFSGEFLKQGIHRRSTFVQPLGKVVTSKARKLGEKLWGVPHDQAFRPKSLTVHLDQGFRPLGPLHF